MTEINWHQRADEAVLEVKHVIGGEMPAVDTGEPIDKFSARDGKRLYQFGAGDAEVVNRAVVSARQAFNGGRWSRLPHRERKAVLLKLADLVEANRERLALYECLDVGKPITNALYDDLARAVGVLRGSAEKIEQLFSPSGSDTGVFAYQQRKPIGVVGGIVGWNYPLALAAGKVGPALAMGNSLVLKPSEFTSLSAWRLAELALEAGVPEGVFNVVNGAGSTVGDALAHHPDVDLLSFVGSSATGKKMMISAGQSNMKRLILECGGKSPYLVFDDCPDDLDTLAADIVATAFPNQGALCVAGTRLLIQDRIKDRLLPKIVEQTRQLVPADPLDPVTTLGAIINEDHMNKILGYISSAREQGADLLYGGKQIHQETGGYYIEPTIFDRVDPNARVAQEEIFGPVLSVMTFNSEEEAIQIANNSCYGLAAYAATENLGRAQRLGQRLNAGSVGIVGTNTIGPGFIELGVEGHKQSGFGMEMGLDGLKAYSVSTAVNLFI